MKIIDTFKYIAQSASYGVLVAIVIILLVPELRSQLGKSSLLNPPSEASAPLSYAKAVERAGPAVVNIYSTDIEQNSRFSSKPREITRLGSGVIMSSDGYILTNLHVVQSADAIRVLLQSGQQFPAELIGSDVITDLAVLKVNAINLPVIPQGKERHAVAGDIVLAIGNPLNLGQTVTQGIISATGRNGLSNTSYSQFLQMDAAINEGNSGGALVNTNGELVGISSRKFTQLNPQINIQGIFFAIPYQLAYKVMEKIIEKGQVVRGWLGVSATQYLTTNQGFVVDDVAPNSPAIQAGIQAGDVVYRIAGIDIVSIEQALDIVAETSPGTTIVFDIYRNNQAIQLPVTIVEFSFL